MRRWTLVGSAVGFCALIALAHAFGRLNGSRPPDSLIPADTVLFAHWEGTELHKAAWEKTAAYEALEKSGLLGTLERFALTYVATDNPAEADAFRELLTSMGRNGFSLAVAFPKGVDEPRVLFVLHGGASREKALRPALMNLVAPGERLETEIVRGRTLNCVRGAGAGESDIAWWTDGGHLLIAFGAGAPESALDAADGKSPCLTSSRLWKASHADQSSFEPMYCGWVDGAALKRRFGGEGMFSGQPKPTINDFVAALGFDKAGAFSIRGGIHGRALVSEAVLEVPAPRTALAALLDQRPLSLADAPPLPANTSGFTLLSLDLNKAFDQGLAIVKDAAALQESTAPAQIDAALAEVVRMTGVDLKRDLFDSLGRVVCLYNGAPASPTPVNIGLAIEVKNPAKLKKTLKILVRALTAQQGFPAQVAVDQIRGRDVFVVDLGDAAPVQPAFTVDKRWLFVGLSSQSIEAALSRVDGKSPAWKPTAAQQAALADAPRSFVMLNLSDPGDVSLGLLALKMFPDPSVTRMLGPLQKSVRSIRSVEKIRSVLFPNVTTWTVDSAGLRGHVRESVPTLISPSTAALAMALMVPQLGNGREADRRAQSSNKIVQIAQACLKYNEANESLPPGTHPNKNLKPEKRLSWQADLLSFVDESSNVHNMIDFSKAWDDKQNETAVTTPVTLYHNPGISLEKTGDEVTHYVGLAGLGIEGPTVSLPSKKAGCFGYDRVTRIADITDGTSHTAMISEASKDYGHWAAGGRPTIRSLTAKPYFNGPDGIGGPFRGGCHVGFADGSVHFLSKKMDPTVFEKLVTIQGGEKVPENIEEAQ